MIIVISFAGQSSEISISDEKLGLLLGKNIISNKYKTKKNKILLLHKIYTFYYSRRANSGFQPRGLIPNISRVIAI